VPDLSACRCIWLGAMQVTTSEYIDAARLLLLVPKDGFLELRALLLERLEQHMEALRCSEHGIVCYDNSTVLAGSLLHLHYCIHTLMCAVNFMATCL